MSRLCHLLVLALEFLLGAHQMVFVDIIKSGSHTISSNTGFLANPSRAAQHAANNAGALTRNEASAIGLNLAGRPSGPFSGPSRALPGFPK